MNCPNCQAPLAGTQKFCPKCGGKVGVGIPEPSVVDKTGAASSTPPLSVVFCPVCGTPNAPHAKFCKNDGTALVAAPEVSANDLKIPNSLPSRIPVVSPPASQQQSLAAIRPQKTNAGVVIGVVVASLVAGGASLWYFVGRHHHPVSVLTVQPAPASSSGVPTQGDAVRVEKPQAGATWETVSAGVMLALQDAGFSRAIQFSANSDLVVALYGSVANEEEKAKVLALVKAVSGVTGVKDQLAFARGPSQETAPGLGTGGAPAQANRSATESGAAQPKKYVERLQQNAPPRSQPHNPQPEIVARGTPPTKTPVEPASKIDSTGQFSCNDLPLVLAISCRVEGKDIIRKCAPDLRNWNNAIPGCNRHNGSSGIL